MRRKRPALDPDFAAGGPLDRALEAQRDVAPFTRPTREFLVLLGFGGTFGDGLRGPLTRFRAQQVQKEKEGEDSPGSETLGSGVGQMAGKRLQRSLGRFRRSVFLL